eukprot:m.41278 g.41278  ORF g.41278 m.41278 type:complete len:63 (+) comp10538_c0_seq2:283-471(+)
MCVSVSKQQMIRTPRLLFFIWTLCEGSLRRTMQLQLQLFCAFVKHGDICNVADFVARYAVCS